MTDIVDANVQALGLYANTGNNLAAERRVVDGVTQAPSSAAEAGPFRVQAVVEHTYTFGQNMPPIHYDIANDQKVQERAWQYPYQGGNLEIAREMHGVQAFDRNFQLNQQPVRTIEQTTGAILSLTT